MLDFRVVQDAEEDIDQAAAVYELDVPGRGARFVRAYLQALDQAREFPHTGERVPDHVTGAHEVRGLPLTHFPYTLYTTVLAERLVVIAVAHQRRLPRFWLERLAKVTP